ncbi:MAG: DNA polymerase III subunit gamma/tau [Tumebacillaceae bacterium]
MAYIALYREWRPQLFGDIVGQEHVTRTLQNALRQKRFAHAYLFNGPRGTGKTSAAKILAKAINCENGPAGEPCNECAACIGITKGMIMDVMEIDAASNRGVDEIRDLRDKVKFAPTEVKYKVYIIDEVHMLTTEAFNALLKTLEEPPHHVMFILATTEPHKLPATIISRCQRFDFRRIMGRQIVDRLRYIAEQKDVKVEEEAYWLVARAAEGGMRDALSIFDQVISFGGDEVRSDDIIAMVGAISSDTLAKIARATAERNVPEALGLIGGLIDNGKDIGQLLHDLVTYFRDLLMHRTVPHLEEIKDRVNYDREFAEVADLFETQRLIAMIEQMTQVQNELKWQTQGRLLLEMLMVRLCKTQSDAPEDLLKRVEELENRLAGGGAPGPFGQGAPMAQAAPVPPDVLRRLAELEKLVARGGIAGAAGGYAEGQRTVPGTAPSRPAAQETAPAAGGMAELIPPEPSPAPTQQPAAHAPAPRVVAVGASGGLEKVVTNPDPAALAHVKQFWQRVLDEVKARKITAQAWLLAGTPVAVDNGNIVVTFKSPIHKETVMKPIHRDIIDPVLTQLMNGNPHHLFAVMEAEWERFQPTLSQLIAHDAPEESAHPAEAVEERDELVEKAKELFGAEHVKVMD